MIHTSAAPDHHDALSDEEIFTFMRRFGRNTNSFVLTYGGNRWFRSQAAPGLVPYVRSNRTLVVAGDPLCAPTDALAVLEDFSRSLGSSDRVALVATSQWLAPSLRRAGFGLVQVGSDPVFDLASWRPQGNRAKKVRSAVNLARRSGVTTSRYWPNNGSGDLEAQMRDCAQAWLASRPVLPLGFLAALQPLAHQEEKRYFLAWHQDQVVSFISCSPVYARNGWYVEDILRRPDAPYGASELLITTALSTLANEGAALATLGLAPFGALRSSGGYPLRTWLLRAAPVLGEAFYHFRGLRHFKKKFAPSWWEPVYLAFRPDKLTPGLVLDIIGSFTSDGLLGLARQALGNDAQQLPRIVARTINKVFASPSTNGRHEP